ncbi:hypothetical protein B0H16DRAFT_1557064 [Mycena metata]|uniref:Uncharacterized protein n=1 Tax=Mycena metata TaxID=1033252 RepID=A0AAD7IPS9_9AGAR|nr:hypothetical protein B0H16DRAFT_1557064 [Mycena metata]
MCSLKYHVRRIHGFKLFMFLEGWILFPSLEVHATSPPRGATALWSLGCPQGFALEHGLINRTSAVVLRLSSPDVDIADGKREEDAK